MDGQLMTDLTAALQWYDGEASAHLGDHVRGRTLADSVRAAVIDQHDRQRAEWEGMTRSPEEWCRGQLYSQPEANYSIDPAVQIADVAATLVSGAVGTFVALESLGDKQLKAAVEKAARLIELARAKGETPADPTPPVDATAAYFAWFVARGGQAAYVERPLELTDKQAADARRELLKRGWIAYGQGALMTPPSAGVLVLAEGGKAAAERLAVAAPIRLGDQDSAA
jgi:hypothetical protein